MAIKRKPLRITADALQNKQWENIPTLDAVHTAFRPAVTCGYPDGTDGAIYMAQDEALACGNVYGMLQQSMSFGGYGSAPQFLGYGVLSNLTQNGIMRNAVEMRSNEMTRKWINLTYDAQSDTQGAESIIPDIQAQMKLYGVRELFRTAAEQCGYMGGCLAYIDIGDISDEELRTPLHFAPETFAQGSLKGFRIIEPFNVAPGFYNTTSPLSPHYFKPEMWYILGKEIHTSRFLYFTENKVPTMLLPAYNFFGIPLVQVALDAVSHFEENREAASRLLSKFSMTVFKTNMADFLAGGADEVSKRIQFLVQNRNNDGVEAIDYETEDIVKVETPLSGITDIVRQSMEICAAYFGEPAVKLWGISPGGFNATGESDIANHYDHIAAIQEGIFSEPLNKVLKVLQLNQFGKIDNALSFEFVPLAKEDKQIKATIQQMKAATAGTLMDRGIISAEEVRRALTEDIDSDYTNIDADVTPEEPDYSIMQGGEPNGNKEDSPTGEAK